MIPFKIMLPLPHLNSEQTISASNWLILTSPQQTPLFISAKEIIISVKISKLLEETSLYSIKMSRKKPILLHLHALFLMPSKQLVILKV